MLHILAMLHKPNRDKANVCFKRRNVYEMFVNAREWDKSLKRTSRSMHVFDECLIVVVRLMYVSKHQCTPYGQNGK